MRRTTAAAALAVGLLVPGLAAAAPADCLVQVENRTLINGACEFTPEPNGDFSVTLGSRIARVLVGSGSLGRASVEDKASGEALGVANVRRDGGCWGQASEIRVCAWLPGQRPAAFQGIAAAAPAPAGMRVVASRAVGEWTFSRLEGGGTWRCEAERRYPDGTTLAFLAVKPGPGSQSAADTGLRFSAPALRGMRGPIRVVPWGYGPEYPHTAVADGNGSATLMDPPNEPGSADGFANGREFEVVLPGGVRLRYALTGSNAAFRAVAQCGGF